MWLSRIPCYNSHVMVFDKYSPAWVTQLHLSSNCYSDVNLTPLAGHHYSDKSCHYREWNCYHYSDGVITRVAGLSLQWWSFLIVTELSLQWRGYHGISGVINAATGYHYSGAIITALAGLLLQWRGNHYSDGLSVQWRGYHCSDGSSYYCSGGLSLAWQGYQHHMLV